MYIIFHLSELVKCDRNELCGESSVCSFVSDSQVVYPTQIKLTYTAHPTQNFNGHVCLLSAVKIPRISWALIFNNKSSNPEPLQKYDETLNV